MTWSKLNANSTSAFSGQKANFLGDSITYGYLLSDPTTQSYPVLVGNILGLNTVRNYGISGSTVSDGSNPMYQRYSAMDNDADIIFFMGGRNDFVSGTTPFGTISSPTSEVSFYGSLKNISEGLINKYPEKLIVFLIPPHGSSSSMPETATNATTGKVYKDYIEAVRDVSELYSFPCVDLWKIAGMQPLVNTQLTDFYQSDGVHPNVLGHQRLASRITGYLKTLQ